MLLVSSTRWLLLVAAMAALARAHPALPQEELAVLEHDLEEDLQDLEDARAVDEAYERLYDNALFLDLADDSTAAKEPAPANLPMDDYDGEMPQGDQPMPDAQPDDADDAQNASTRAASPAPAGSDRPDDTKEAAPATSPSTPSGPQAHAASRKSERERDRELRLQHIKSQVLQYLGLPPDGQHPLSNMSSNRQQLSVLRVVGQMNLPNVPPQDIIAEKVTSHYPACALPRNTDEALWSEGRSMRLLFELPNHPPPAGTSANVVQATLRLFKVSQGGSAAHPHKGPICMPSVATTAAAAAAAFASTHANTEDDDGVLDGDGLGGHAPVPLHALLGMAQADDRQVRVSVYWYTRSLKKNKNGVVVEKRKLLDSRMLAVHGSAWTEWNVRTAVKVWRESGRNFGLVVEVEDEDGTRLDAHQFFNGMNCTQEASNARPIPSFLLDRLNHSSASGYREPGGAASGAYAHAFNQNLFPVIDLCTVETTDSSGGGALSSSGYDFGVLGLGRQSKQATKHKPSAPARAESRGHKHRHQHQDDVKEADEEAEPVARRWPRARAGQDDRTLHQRIVLAASAARQQHAGKDR
ncbi:uncharacterized protein LOC117644110 isoform X2 [Thrips palmi]|uniref:Uncharacterized protein LOC117644110 isoform X2 n=1 Tax=Thrips palmi TaxID=161013 RepID=A0A6P8ZLP7_THRPL|nr:uncharacterized protein LOC117644110 isoform X2 [Thrips palmi]